MEEHKKEELNDEEVQQIKRKFGGKQAGAGRPKGSGRQFIQLDRGILERLCEACLPQTSIAVIMGCSVDTLRRNYMDILAKSREKRKLTLLESMWHKALVEKDCKMQIWLSKQHLGYKEAHPDDSVKTNFNIIISQIPK